MTKKAKKVGRPVEPVPQKIAEAIVDWVSRGNTLAAFCELPNAPGRRTVYDWLEKDAKFAARFARARELGFDALADKALSVAANPEIGVTESEEFDGNEITTKTTKADNVQRSKLYVWTVLQLLARWDPKRYGERQTIEHQGELQLTQQVAAARARATRKKKP